MALSVQLGAAPAESVTMLPLTDSSGLINDPKALRAALEKQGYLYLPGLLPRDKVLEARMVVLQHLAQLGHVLDPARPVEEGVFAADCQLQDIPFMEGRNAITHHPSVLRVIESEEVRGMFRVLFGEEARTFDYKWLRAMHRTGFTGAHVDNVYMSRGTPQLHTVWVPFGDVSMSMGTLAVCEGSHNLPGFQRLQQTYGSMDVEAEGLQGTGWFTNDPREIVWRFGGQWRSNDFAAGDVIVFGLRTLHMSTVNVSPFVRISCDTRWMPVSHTPDPRYVGAAVGHTDAKFGVLALDKDKAPSGVTMEQKRMEWGLA